MVSPEWSEVVYSAGDPNTDTDDLSAYNTNKRQREKIIERFKDKNSSLKFLLVCDMLLTGFDAPIEQVYWISHWDHNLLQAIAKQTECIRTKAVAKSLITLA